MARPRQVSDEQILEAARSCFLEHGPAVSTTVIAKRLGISGQGSFIMALVCGVVFGALYQAMNTGLVPEAALPWIRVVIVGLGFAVAATGLYDIGKKVLIGAEEFVENLFFGGAPIDETLDH